MDKMFNGLTNNSYENEHQKATKPNVITRKLF